MDEKVLEALQRLNVEYEEFIFPSGGTDRCAIGITPEDLYKAAQCSGRIDVCK